MTVQRAIYGAGGNATGRQSEFNRLACLLRDGTVRWRPLGLRLSFVVATGPRPGVRGWARNPVGRAGICWRTHLLRTELVGSASVLVDIVVRSTIRGQRLVAAACLGIERVVPRHALGVRGVRRHTASPRANRLGMGLGSGGPFGGGADICLDLLTNGIEVRRALLVLKFGLFDLILRSLTLYLVLVFVRQHRCPRQAGPA
ncbi:MAG: hypothetical protein ACRDGV_06425 [Candidatus Limnocylindria bacterium]